MAIDRTLEDVVEKKVFKARNIGELFYQKKTVRDLVVIGAGTTMNELPQKFISTKLTRDLRKLQQHERYMDIGPAVTLGTLESFSSHCPKILLEALKTIANPFVRNIATIGGNIMTNEITNTIPKTDTDVIKTFPMKMTLYAPLIALDTQLELQSVMSTISIPMQKFQGVPDGYVLCNIRIPRVDWEISIYRRLGPKGVINIQSASYAFLMTSAKSTIASVRIAFSGIVSFRAIALEGKLLGLRLPISRATFNTYIEEALGIFDEEAAGIQYPAILRKQFENLVAYSLEQLA